MNDEGVVQFNPPLYMQRYSMVLDILSKERPKKVVDFGCAECKLIQLLKSEEYLEEICGVDIDRALLDGVKWKIGPLTTDYINPRTRPLTVTLMQGSVFSSSPALADYDVVTCIELIEHLEPEGLPDLKKNVFGFIRPTLVVISTPNADFNVLFPPNGSKFRHWDHKFEWTMKEFQNWCHKVCEEFNYSVIFDGVGTAPKNKTHLGYCSQFAIFRRVLETSEIDRKIVPEIDEAPCFETVAVSIHPFASAKTQQEKQFYSKFFYRVNALLSACRTMLSSVENNTTPIISSLQRTFMHLRLKNSTLPQNFINKHKKVSSPLSQDQFADAEVCGSNGCNFNTYGQERYLVVVEPSKATRKYLQKLRDSYLNSCDILPSPDQFEDSETDSQSSRISLLKKKKAIHYDRIVDLSQYESDIPFRVRVTEGSMDGSKTFTDDIVLYKTSQLLKVPLLLINNLDEIKSFNFDEITIENILSKENPEGIQICREGNETFLLLDLENFDSVSRDRRWSRSSESSCSLSSYGSSTPSSPFPAFNAGEFSEENWDSD